MVGKVSVVFAGNMLPIIDNNNSATSYESHGTVNGSASLHGGLGSWNRCAALLARGDNGDTGCWVVVWFEACAIRD